MQKKISELLGNIDAAYSIDKCWEVWSGDFNRGLRKMSAFNPAKAKKYALVFSYWQIKNKMWQTDESDEIALELLEETALELKVEALS